MVVTYVGIWVFNVLTILVLPFAFALPNTLRAAGDAQMTMWISIGSMWVFRIGLSSVLGKYVGWGVFGVWVAMVIDWGVRAILIIWRYLSGRWKYKKTI